MRLYEYESKALLKDVGIAVPRGEVVGQAAEIKGQGTLILKSQVLSGGRMKAGGISRAADCEDARASAAKLLGKDLLGHRVEKLLVEERVDIAREYFAAVTYDLAKKRPLAIFCAEGGVDIEELSRTSPEKVITREFSLLDGFGEHLGREIASAAGLLGADLMKVADAMGRMAELFARYDATIVEINPLVKTPGGDFVAVDAHIDIDDDALYRHPELQSKFSIPKREPGAREVSHFERKAAEIDRIDHRGVAGRMIEFDGNIGLLIGGGGASLAAFDAVRKHGGEPANYCEIGGNPSVRKVKELVKLLLSKPGVERIAVMMNVVSNTRVDLVARGVIKGIIERGEAPSEKIAIFRIPGSYEEEGFRILRKYGVEYCDRSVSIDEAAQRAVAKFKAA